MSYPIPPTPLGKLQRLKELDRDQTTQVLTDAEKTALVLECQAILETVGIPPTELLENPDPTAWAAVFTSTFGQLDTPTVFTWFALAMEAAARRASSDNLASAAAHQECVDTLILIRDGLKAGKIKAPTIQRIGHQPRPLVELVVETLAGAGVRE